MLTLNLKVLFNNACRGFGMATLIWFVTSLTGTIALAPTHVIGIPFYQILLLSMVFSTPSFAVLTPALMIRPAFPTRVSKFFYVCSIGVFSCIAVIVFFLFVTKGYPLEPEVRQAILTPYVVAAMITVPISIYYFNTSNHKNKA